MHPAPGVRQSKAAAALCEKIADEGRCVFVNAVGHTALFYRQHPDPKERTIALP